jgi:alkanesulfonate monooxygenase SsuD/methylene tetrahydromethanopterin reductase-like flavin-dependent oxidoreductase (luciferase family)
MLELAGESADGVFVNGLGGWPPALKNALRYVEAGARQAGRSLHELDVVCWTRIAISEDPDALRDLIRPVIGLKLSVVPDNILKERFGIGPELAHLIKERFEALKRNWDPLRPVGVLGGNIEDLIADSFVEKYCLCGTPEQIVHRIRQLLDAGATQISLLNWPRRDRPEDLSDIRIKTLRTFAEYVIPAFRDS